MGHWRREHSIVIVIRRHLFVLDSQPLALMMMAVFDAVFGAFARQSNYGYEK